jgi:dTMP kinase
MDRHEPGSNMTRLTEGILIVFEGIDGTGKSTQLELLAAYLREHGYDVVETREPTSGMFGQKIRNLYQNRDGVTIEEELELFLADRKEHVTELIAPSLLAKKIVLCDRYYLSTAAYQGAAGLDPVKIIERNRFAPTPHLALVFELDPTESIRRITEKRRDSLNDFEQLDSLKKVDTVFKKMQLPFITRIDASQTEQSISRLVLTHIMSLLDHYETKNNQ